MQSFYSRLQVSNGVIGVVFLTTLYQDSFFFFFFRNAVGRFDRRQAFSPRVQAVCSQRWCTTSVEPLPTPQPDGAPRAYPEKLSSLVREISGLTLSEVAQLNELLKASIAPSLLYAR